MCAFSETGGAGGEVGGIAVGGTAVFVGNAGVLVAVGVSDGLGVGLDVFVAVGDGSKVSVG